MTCAPAVTLDRFCGSGITAVNLAAATIMAGMADMVVAGGTEMMSMPNRRDARRRPAAVRHRQSAPARDASQTNQGVCADAIATLEGITREDVDKARARKPAPRRGRHRAGHSKEPHPVHNDDGSVALDHEEFPRPGTTLEGLASLKASFAALADVPSTKRA